MPYINRDKILYGSPKKRLIIGFENLKQNFTEEAALEYSKLYKDQALSFIIENSRLIFAEPYYGYDFYKETMCGENEYVAFPKYRSEIDKLNTFIDDNQNKMPADQLSMYVNLRDRLMGKLDDYKNSETLIGYCADKDPKAAELASNISDKVYDYKKAEMVADEQLMNQLQNGIKNDLNGDIDSTMFFTLAPYVGQATSDNTILNDNIKKFAEEPNGSWTEKPTIESAFDRTIILSKLMNDKAYNEAIKYVPRASRVILNEYAKEDLGGNLQELITERVSSDRAFYSTPMMAVLNVFAEDDESNLFNEEFDEFRENRYGIRLHVFEKLMDLITYEYQTCEDTNEEIQGYNFFKEGTTIEEAFAIVNKNLMDTKRVLNITEAEASDEEDVSDEDIDNMEQDANDVPERVGTSTKKPKAPKPKNLANKIQFKAMDAEVRQNEMRAAAKQRGQEIKNAAKAAGQLPANVIADIKDQTKKIDEADDDRRKKYMLEPGFRKKGFRNLKLGLLYGTAARAKLALVPVIAVCRHFSKKKDMRIRNELTRELDTEIKITEEKINDANSAGDNKEKYQLMRIKSKLEAEKARVKMNSKYI